MSIERVPHITRIGDIKFPFSSKKATRKFKKILGVGKTMGGQIGAAFKVVKTYCAVSDRVKTGFYATKAPKVIAAPFAIYGIVDNVSKIVLGIIEMAERGISKERIFSCVSPAFEFIVNADAVTDAVAASMEFLSEMKVIAEKAADWVSTFNVVSFIVGFISVGFATKSLYSAQTTYRSLTKSLHEAAEKFKTAKDDRERADILLEFLKKLEGEDPRRDEIISLYEKLMEAPDTTAQANILSDLLEKVEIPRRKRKTVEQIKEKLRGEGDVDALLSELAETLQEPSPEEKRVEHLHQRLEKIKNAIAKASILTKLLKEFDLPGLTKEKIKSVQTELQKAKNNSDRADVLVGLVDELKLLDIDIEQLKRECAEDGDKLLIGLLKALQGPTRTTVLQEQLKGAEKSSDRAEILISLLKRYEGPDVRKQTINALHKKLMLSQKRADLKGRIERIAEGLKMGQKTSPEEAEKLLSKLKSRVKLQLGFSAADLANRIAGTVGAGIVVFAPPAAVVGFIIMACSSTSALVLLGTRLLFINKNPFDPESRNRINSLVHKALELFDTLIERLKAFREKAPTTESA